MGGVGDKKVGLSSFWTSHRCARIYSTARQKNHCFSILDSIPGGHLCSDDLCSLTSLVLFSEWRYCLQIVLQQNYAWKGLQENSLALMLVHLFFIVHPQSSGVSETQKLQLYPLRTTKLKLQSYTAENVAYHRERESLDLSAKSCKFQMWFCIFKYLMLYINVTWRLAVTYSRLLQ